MRNLFAGLVVVVAALLAACGGGGGANHGILPSSGSGGTAPVVPGNAKTTHASMRLYIPAPSKQASRKPLYIGSDTLSFGILVVPAGSTASPSPANEQIFPVATPSPCSENDGAYACTLTVAAPVGTDIFYVAAYNVASPGPNAVPLSYYISGSIAVSANATPALSFTLNGLAYSVAVTVPSPDPSNTPETQVFTVASPTTAALPITAYDAGGIPILSGATTPFASPGIIINASPAAEGVTLALSSPSQCGSTIQNSGAQAVIGCVADLNDLVAKYDGTVHTDTSYHIIDAFAIVATAQPSPSPSPANIVLASNVQTIEVLPNSLPAYNEPSLMQRISDGRLLYVANLYNYETSAFFPEIGAYTPSTGTATTAVQLGGYPLMNAVAVSSSAAGQAVWATGSTNNSYVPLEIECFSSLSSLLSGGSTTPAISNFTPTLGGYPVSVSAVAIDSLDNLWYAGYEDWDVDAPPPGVIGYFSAANGCTTPGSANPQYLLNGDTEEEGTNMVALPGSTGGIAFVSSTIYSHGAADYTNGVYIVSPTTPSGTISPSIPAVSNDYEGTGVAVDNAGTPYAAFNGAGSTEGDIEYGSSLAQLLAPPYPSSGIGSPTSLSVFSPTAGGAADRAIYSDAANGALGIVESVPASPMPILVTFPNEYEQLASAYDASGGEYALYTDLDANFYIGHTLLTRTWNVLSLPVGVSCGDEGMLSILERGDSGHVAGGFGVSVTGTGVAATPFTGSTHTYQVYTAGAGTFGATITDGARKETLDAITTNNECAGARRRPSTKRGAPIHA